MSLQFNASMDHDMHSVPYSPSSEYTGCVLAINIEAYHMVLCIFWSIVEYNVAWKLFIFQNSSL